MEEPSEIDEISDYASYADGIGPWIGLLEQGNLMKQASKHDLVVHAYTLRQDQIGKYRSFEFMLEDILHHKEVNGVFTDHPDVVKAFKPQVMPEDASIRINKAIGDSGYCSRRR